MGAKPFIKDRGEIGLPIIAGALVLFGMVMIYSASGVLAGHRMGDSAYFLKRQLLWTLIALPLAVAASRIDYQRWKGWLAALALFVLLLLLAVLLPGVGREVNGSRRWLPVLGLTVQPSEFAKLFVVIYTAHYLSRKEGIFPPLAVSGLAAVLIMIEPDFGTTVSLLMVVGLLLFVGGAPIRHLATLALVGFPMLATWALSSPYRRERLLTFLDPWQDPTRHGFQIIQSYLALGGGGALGLGLGEGRQKLFYLPEPHTDFIFAVAGEELGLLGTTILLTLFFLLLLKGMRLAMRTEEPFGRYLAAGLTLMVVLPALLNMGVVTGLLPTKGLPLPLVSYGGSSLLVNMTAIGLLYNISRQPKTGGLLRERMKEVGGGAKRGKRKWRK